MKQANLTNTATQRLVKKIGFRQWPAISVLASMAVLAMPAAHAQDSGWYTGINAGRTNTTFNNGGVDSAFSGQGVTSSSSADKHDNTYSLNLGYKFNPNFALEGGYVDLGKYNYGSTITAPAADTASGNYKVDGWTTTAVGILPLKNGFSAYGKLGAFFSDTKLSAASTGASPVSGASKSGTNATYGLGVSYDLDKNWVSKVEWNRYQGVGDSSTGKADIDAYTVGLAYKF